MIMMMVSTFSLARPTKTHSLYPIDQVEGKLQRCPYCFTQEALVECLD